MYDPDDQLRFVVTVADDGDGTAIVSAHGELDSYAAGPFDDTLRSIVQDASFRRVILDFSKVTFLDSGGAGVLLDAAKLASTRGGRLTLVANDIRVTRIVELTGLAGMLDVQRSLADVIGNGLDASVDGTVDSGRAPAETAAVVGAAMTADDIGRAVVASWQLDGPVEDILSLFDLDAELRPLPGDERVFTGHDGIDEWLRGVRQWMVYRSYQMRSTKLADDACVITGRLQWMEDQQLRDEQVAWLVELRGGRVWKSTALRTAREAEEAYARRLDGA